MMGIIPEPGVVSICEINRELLVSKGAEDTAAQDRYTSTLGRSYPTLRVHEDTSPSSAYSNSPVITVTGDFTTLPSQQNVREVSTATTADGALKRSWQQAALATSQSIQGTLRHWISPQKVESGRSSPQPGVVSWHEKVEKVAVIGEHDRVILFNYEKPGSVPSVLLHEFQKNVSALSWRPNAAAMIAVGCREGVCLWTVDPTATEQRGTPSGVRVAKATMVFLQATGKGSVSSLCWSPCGRLLAFATSLDSTISLCDAASGAITCIRRGFGGIKLLSWSPSGDYFLSANLDGNFHLWETASWTSEPWQSADGAMTSVVWSPNSAVMLAGFEGTTTLTALNFAAPPSLNAHLVPLKLTDLVAVKASSVSCMSWDASGERLAVSYRGGEGGSEGLVALFSTRWSPMVAVTLIGYLRGPEEGCSPLNLSFHATFTRGALLAVRWSSGSTVVYPMVFKGVWK